MSRNPISSGASRRLVPWPLELELELCDPGRCEATAERLGSLTELLNAAAGIALAAVEKHGRGNLVRVYLTVDAFDADHAHDRACAAVHEHVGSAGLGPAILVAARPAERKPAGRRMG